MIRKFNIDGCRRRRGDPGRGRPRFHCDGDVGPPCIVKRGDMVYLDVDFGSGTIFATYKSEWGFEVSSREYFYSGARQCKKHIAMQFFKPLMSLYNGLYKSLYKVFYDCSLTI